MRGKEILWSRSQLTKQNFTICRKWPSRLCDFQVPLKGNSLIRSSVPEKCKNCVSFKFKSNFVAYWILINDIEWRLINMNFCTLVRQLQPLSYWKTSGKQWKKKSSYKFKLKWHNQFYNLTNTTSQPCLKDSKCHLFEEYRKVNNCHTRTLNVYFHKKSQTHDTETHLYSFPRKCKRHSSDWVTFTELK